ncbi:hypothetical protein [Nocardia sp. NPDC052566]|uniref:hypothetical protein n=1 Tax=Nocardia sp. NPDC052566 TaxID=3364330 RepID=UPI0037CC855D
MSDLSVNSGDVLFVVVGSSKGDVAEGTGGGAGGDPSEIRDGNHVPLIIAAGGGGGGGAGGVGEPGGSGGWAGPGDANCVGCGSSGGSGLGITAAQTDPGVGGGQDGNANPSGKGPDGQYGPAVLGSYSCPPADFAPEIGDRTGGAGGAGRGKGGGGGGGGGMQGGCQGPGAAGNEGGGGGGGGAGSSLSPGAALTSITMACHYGQGLNAVPECAPIDTANHAQQPKVTITFEYDPILHLLWLLLLGGALD